MFGNYFVMLVYMNKQNGFKVIDGRNELETQFVQALFGDSEEKIKSLSEQIAPKGKLKLVSGTPQDEQQVPHQ